MKIKLKQLDYFLFYISYFLFFLYAFFGTIEIFKQPLKMLTNISMVLIIIVFIFDLKKYKYNELIKISFVFILSLIFIFETKNYLFLKLILIIIISKNIEFDKRVSFDMKLRIIFLIAMYVMYLLGISEDVTALYKGKIRHSLGFSNPNVLGMHVFILCLEIIYLSRNKLTISKLTICLIIILISNIYSGSRTIVYLFLFLLILLWLYKKNNKIYYNKLVRTIIIYSPLITTLVTCIIYQLYLDNNVIALQLDNVLSGRLRNIKFFTTNYPITLFGNDIASANKTCDTVAVYMLYAFGICGLSMYLIAFQELLKKLYKNKKLILIIIVYLFIIYGISEKLWLFADCNILITALSYIIFYNDSSNKEENCEK